MIQLFFVFMLLVQSVQAAVPKHYNTSSGPKPGILNVHLVPHSHEDPGWWKTVDQYYTGARADISHAASRLILDSLVATLSANPDRRFIYAEQAFFQRWWKEQDNDVKAKTELLIRNGQLEFVNGGWCMHDEGTTFYLDMIDQTSLGHRVLKEQFNVTPTVGWQVDPFGHSATQAALLGAEAGLNSVFFGRLDYQDRLIRIAEKSAEFIWRPSPSLGPSAQVFAGLTGQYSGDYGSPQGLCWDILGCRDEPVQDDTESDNYNVPSRVQDFVNAAMSLGENTRGNHVMFTLGGDFQYMAAPHWYNNLDKMIHYVNLDGRVNAFYSNMSAYVASKQISTSDEGNIEWPLKTDDFFPYADNPHAFWTGFFTSMPALKRYVRVVSSLQVAMRQIGTISGTAGIPELAAMEESLGLVQHHDAITGTSKTHVSFDYAARLARGVASSEKSILPGLMRLLEADAVESFNFCHLLNESVCPTSQNILKTSSTETLVIMVWNSLSREQNVIVNLPVNISSDSEVEVLAFTANKSTSVSTQLVPSLPPINNYGISKVSAPLTLTFPATLPAIGYQVFTARVIPKNTTSQRKQRSRASETQERVLVNDVSIENEFLKLSFNSDGSLRLIENKFHNISVPLTQSFQWYNASVGDNLSGQKSGAYIFRPDSNTSHTVGKISLQKVVRGKLVQEVHQVFGDGWVHQRIRLSAGARHAEFTFTVGPIPLTASGNTASEAVSGKEVISRFESGIQSGKVWYSDSNGREMQRRELNFRPSWEFNQTESIAGNYVPVTSAVFIRDQQTQLTVLTDSAQGATSLKPGQIELMIHRRLLEDDNKGVGEPLNETQFITPMTESCSQCSYTGNCQEQGCAVHYGPGLIVRGTHFLTLEPKDKAASIWRPLMDQVYMQPLIALGKAKNSLMLESMRGRFTALRNTLPENVALLTLLRQSDNEWLIRLGHQFGVNEDSSFSEPVHVELETLFQPFVGQILSVTELTLTGNQDKSDLLHQRKQTSWNVEGERHQPSDHAWRHVPAVDWDAGVRTVVLGPLEIKTFRIKLKEK
eukprot:m.344721 g.344721  ORF g.344721 m.344721 type:complete len:1047 (-) comp25011_c0_seq1:126-3266(-)